MNYWHEVSRGKEYPETFNVIIEIPRGSCNKYEVDKETGLIKLDRVNYGAMYYPMDYGFVPQTYWHDGDPVDVLVITTHSLLPGILVECRAIACLDMVDGGDDDVKLIAVPVDDPRFKEYQDIDDIAPHTIAELKHFFETYKQLQGKEVRVGEVQGRTRAIEALQEAQKLYEQKFATL